MFRLIENRKAKNPYYHEMISVHIYTLEELCYYMETNIYLVDKSWIGEGLFQWLAQELQYSKLAADLHSEYRKTKDVFRCVEMIFTASGIYSQQDMNKMCSLFDIMRGKTNMERRKLQGDLFLDSGKYRQAAYTYMELLQPEYARRMTEELRGNICHNLGVVYARLFLFPEAAQMFAEAYKLRKNIQTREAYLYAMNYVEDTYPMEEQLMDLNFSVMREALNHFSEVSDNPDFYRERKAASTAAGAFDWKSKQTELIQRWKNDFKVMNS